MEEAEAYRAALARQVRHDAAAKNFTTFMVEVREQSGSWLLSVPDIPGLQERVHKRQDITPGATGAIASALESRTTSSSCTSASRLSAGGLLSIPLRVSAAGMQTLQPRAHNPLGRRS